MHQAIREYEIESVFESQKEVYYQITELLIDLGEPYIFKTNTTKILGYGRMHYTNTIYDGNYPPISLIAYKNKISIYIMYFPNGEPYVNKYISVFGKSNLGKSCIRISKLKQMKKP
jgi:hypothetical protein